MQRNGWGGMGAVTMAVAVRKSTAEEANRSGNGNGASAGSSYLYSTDKITAKMKFALK